MKHPKKNILAICGSASNHSANLAILTWITALTKVEFTTEIIDSLTELPHFKTALSDQNTPEKIVALRQKIANADGIIICTPEYVFSIPSGLKNMIEWCVSTTVFSDKPIALITASAQGEKAHEEIQLIMKTVQTKFTEETTLLIQGVKGKVHNQEGIIDKKTANELRKLVQSFCNLVQISSNTTHGKN